MPVRCGSPPLAAANARQAWLTQTMTPSRSSSAISVPGSAAPASLVSSGPAQLAVGPVLTQRLGEVSLGDMQPAVCALPQRIPGTGHPCCTGTERAGQDSSARPRWPRTRHDRLRRVCSLCWELIKCDH